MSNELNKFIGELGLGERVSGEKYVRQSKSYKEKVINSIKNEIKLIESRSDLKIQKINKRVDGEIKEVNENRFWKVRSNKPNSVIFNIKVKSKIFGFGEEVDRYSPHYFECENNKDVLIKKLTDIMEGLEKLDVNHKFFQLPNSKNNNTESNEEVTESVSDIAAQIE